MNYIYTIKQNKVKSLVRNKLYFKDQYSVETNGKTPITSVREFPLRQIQYEYAV